MKTFTLVSSFFFTALLLGTSAQAAPFGATQRMQAGNEQIQLAGQQNRGHARRQHQQSQRNATISNHRSSGPARYSAQPYRQQQPRQQRQQRQQHPRHHREWSRQHSPRQQPPRQVIQHHHHYHRSPPPVTSLRQQVYGKRHHFKRGPALPRHVVIVQGRPMPHGWGRPLPYNQVRHLPHYPGYEWRLAGRDLILIAATTGIVYAILDNVL